MKTRFLDVRNDAVLPMPTDRLRSGSEWPLEPFAFADAAKQKEYERGYSGFVCTDPVVNDAMLTRGKPIQAPATCVS